MMRVGTSRAYLWVIMADHILESATFAGVSYLLLACAAVVVRDDDAHELVTRVNYPTMARAQAAYLEAIALAEVTA